jgi:hypothetical protein
MTGAKMLADIAECVLRLNKTMRLYGLEPITAILVPYETGMTLKHLPIDGQYLQRTPVVDQSPGVQICGVDIEIDSRKL